MLLQYGADGQKRFSELVVGGETTHRYYLGDYELQILPDGSTEQIHYVGGGVITVNDESGWQNYYTHTDHLGSILAVTDESGSEYARQSFDAWGRQRNPDDLTFENITEHSQSWLYRGYTGHEMLPDFDLINMNGRLYDNIIGRMLSPDNFSGHGGTSQGFNRYSYVLNNPLKYTDPTGENPLVGAGLGFIVGSLGTRLAGGTKNQSFWGGVTGAAIGAGIQHGTFKKAAKYLGKSLSNLSSPLSNKPKINVYLFNLANVSEKFLEKGIKHAEDIFEQNGLGDAFNFVIRDGEDFNDLDDGFLQNKNNIGFQIIDEWDSDWDIPTDTDPLSINDDSKWNRSSGATKAEDGRSDVGNSWVNIYGNNVRNDANGFGYILAHEVVHGVMWKIWPDATMGGITDSGGHISHIDYKYFENLMNDGNYQSVDKILSGKLGQHTKIPFEMRTLISTHLERLQTINSRRNRP